MDLSRLVPGLGGVAAGLLVLAAKAALAQESQVKIELNKLESVENACRVYLVIENNTPTDFASLQIELVSFDESGLIGQRLAVDLAPLRAEKTLVKLFDMPEARCEAIDRLLLNDVLVCEGGQVPAEQCLDLLVPNSRASARFWK